MPLIGWEGPDAWFIGPIEHVRRLPTDTRVTIGALVGVVLLFIAGLVVLASNAPDDARYWRVFVIGWLLAAAASIPAVALLVYLDRRDPEPWWAGSLAYFWGALVATGLGLVIRIAALGSITEAFDQTAGLFDTAALGVQIAGPSVVLVWLDTALLAPVVEEVIKALALLILVAFLPSLINGVRDGVVYGALVGLGFAVAETARELVSERRLRPVHGPARPQIRVRRGERACHLLGSVRGGARIGDRGGEGALGPQDPARRWRGPGSLSRPTACQMASGRLLWSC